MCYLELDSYKNKENTYMNKNIIDLDNNKEIEAIHIHVIQKKNVETYINMLPKIMKDKKMEEKNSHRHNKNVPP